MGLFSSDPKEYSTLSPDQQQLSSALGPQLTALANAGQAGSTYQGTLSAPITDQEQTNVNNAARFGAVGGATLDSLANYNDASFNDQFQKEMVDPTMSNFRTNVQPGIEESLPTFSTARGVAVQRALQDTSNSLMQQRYTAREDAKNRALNAVTAGSNFYSNQANTLAIPREIQQAGLDREYNNFYQGNQAYQAGLNTMLGYLGIQTKYAVQQPSTMDKINTALNTAQSAEDIATGMPSASSGGGTGGTPSGVNGASGSWMSDVNPSEVMPVPGM